MPNSIPEKPWRHISADFIVKLPLAQEYNTILVVCNHLTKMAHFIPTTEKTTAARLARLFRDNVWKLHSLPESIISDRGAQFAAGMIKELNERLGIRCHSCARTSGSVLYGLPLHQKGNVNKATW